jgi:3-phosphoshikimate 1-carboxyvinyltransferase
MAALTEGVSEIERPLDSLDASSCVRVCRALGAEIAEYRAVCPHCANPPDERGEKLVRWVVRGRRRRKNTGRPVLDVGNSGTTLFLALAAAALDEEETIFTGDEQTRRRDATPLLSALEGLGVSVTSTGGCAPISVRGPWKGGKISLPCPTSQYLSALLIAAPLAPPGTVTEIDVPLLNEKPYIDLTLAYLREQGIPWESRDDYSWFRIPGGAAYTPVNGPVPGDFSSAAFPACAAAVSGGTVTLRGLQAEDPQGDKALFGFLNTMGCTTLWTDGDLTISRQRPLIGGEFDLNATPDMLPVMAVLGAYAQGETRLVNATHARIKETDRIAVMALELAKFGAHITERPDGLIIQGGRIPSPGMAPEKTLRVVQGHGDHRVVMALASAALASAGITEIDDAECAAVTYPGFLELLQAEIRNVRRTPLQ